MENRFDKQDENEISLQNSFSSAGKNLTWKAC